MLQVTQTAPLFSAPDHNNRIINLADYRGKKHVILYFYPKDDTPGCTIEANQFTALAQAFSDADAVVIGVSRDSCASHQSFISKFGLELTLLADTSGEVCERYAVWQEKEKNGMKKMGIVRSTFVIDKEGVLQAAMYGVNPEGHAADILKLVQQL